MLVIMWPIFSGYMEWVSMWINGVKIRETLKKVIVVVLIMGLVFLSVMLAYACILTIGVYGISSVVALGVYR